MVISVYIEDRLYDYTDEECASDAVLDFQEKNGLSDQQILEIWFDSSDPFHSQLQAVVYEAIDKNGTVKRAQESIPGGITITAL